MRSKSKAEIILAMIVGYVGGCALAFGLVGWVWNNFSAGAIFGALFGGWIAWTQLEYSQECRECKSLALRTGGNERSGYEYRCQSCGRIFHRRD